ncbi:MAG: hypothetical protein HFI32_11910 [Lachnospiraceae bacterium]|nr:hypothetical protein [Lachnospiraceae bacterium]
MNMIFKAVGRNVWGVGYKRLSRTLILYLVIFWSLRISGLEIKIAPSILYVMAGAFSASMMWQALLSERNGANMENMFMLPFEKRRLAVSYVAALGVYTLFTKTAGLLAVALAVSPQRGTVILGSLLSAGNAVLAAACIYSRKNLRGVMGSLWAGILAAALLFLGKSLLILPVLAGSFLMAAILLQNTDPYLFYFQGQKPRQILRHPHEISAFRNKGRSGSIAARCSVWRYLFRYLTAHKNYLANTAALWGVACLLPVLFESIESRFALPVGFAILSINTPLCILLSSDPALEQAIRFLPGQKTAFCIPYGLFLFTCNMTANIIFLCSWKIQMGALAGSALPKAGFFALFSAAGSVSLEWYCPIRKWKIESDLWHHPRKYVVPVVMLLFAGITSVFW